MAKANTKPGKVVELYASVEQAAEDVAKEFAMYETAKECEALAIEAKEEAEKAKKEAEEEITLQRSTGSDARIKMLGIIKKAEDSGFPLGKTARTCALTKAIQSAFMRMGYAETSAAQKMSEIRNMLNGKEPRKSEAGKKRAKTGARAGKNAPDADKTGMSFDLPLKSKPETLRNKIKALAEHVRSEYKDNETMLRIAAYLADVDEA